MSFKSEEDRQHFLLYAFSSLDKKHYIPEDYRNKVLLGAKNDKAPEKLEDEFMTAIAGCSALSKMKGEEKISKKIIDDYFLGPHNDHSDCKAYRGTVMKLDGIDAIVQTPQGPKVQLRFAVR